MAGHRNALIVRHWRILTLLKSVGADGLTLHAIALRVGVHQRTVRRDVEALTEAHVPIASRREGATMVIMLSSATCPLCGRERSVA